MPDPSASGYAIVRIDSLSWVEVGAWPTQNEVTGLKIHLQSRGEKYYSFNSFFVTAATCGENDRSSGPARCNEESLYQIKHYAPMFNTECHVKAFLMLKEPVDMNKRARNWNDTHRKALQKKKKQ